MSCKHGNWSPCDECEAEDAAWQVAYKAGYEEGGKISIDLTLKHLRRAELAEQEVAKLRALLKIKCETCSLHNCAALAELKGH